MTPSQRLGAWCFAIGSAVFIATISSYTFAYGTPQGTAPDGSVTIADSARHMLDNAGLIRTIWIVEVLAVVMHAVAGFALASRKASEQTLAPAGWLLLGIGSTAYLAMYPTMLGTYWPAAEAVETVPALLESANEQAVAAFLIANIPINLGFVLIYAAEARLPERVLPRWLAWLGCASALVVFIGLVAVLATHGGMAQVMYVAPLAGLLFIISVIFGLRLARAA